jgi:hypothetical protein
VAQTSVWFGVGLAYVLLGVFNCYWAKRLRPIAKQSLARYSITLSEEERQKLDETQLHELWEKQKLLDERKISREAYQISFELFKDVLRELREMRSNENLNKAFDNIENFVDGVNNATDVNRRVLYAAALSFFFAAAISVLQGLSIIRPSF